MSDTEQEGMTERELAQFFADEVFSDKPKSVGEALAAADEAASAPVVDEPAPAVSEPPVVVSDEPVQDTPAPVTEGELAPEPVEEPEAEGEDLDTEDDPNVVWAKKKYGEDTAKWAKAARDQEQHISRLAAEKKEAEDIAGQWYAYAQQAEQQAAQAQQMGMPLSSAEEDWIEQSLVNPLEYARQAAYNGNVSLYNAVLARVAEELAGGWYEEAQRIQAEAAQQQQMGMPLSSAEENWIEQSLVNPLEYARQAAYNGNVSLYNAVLARVAEENPGMAVQIGTQVQMEMQALAEQNGQVEQPLSLQETLNYSIQRLGIDLPTYGPAMSEKIAELGEHDPYVQTILGGDQAAREMALKAVYDLVRATSMSTRRVRSEEREAQIKHEADLRRQAAGVVTGGPTLPEPPKQSAFMDAMEAEWRQRGQWSDE